MWIQVAGAAQPREIRQHEELHTAQQGSRSYADGAFGVPQITADAYIHHEGGIDQWRSGRIAAKQGIRYRHEDQREQECLPAPQPGACEDAHRAHGSKVGRVRQEAHHGSQHHQPKRQRSGSTFTVHTIPHPSLSDKPEAAWFGSHNVSGAFDIWLAQRLQTKNPSLNRFRYMSASAGTCSLRESATHARSARRHTVRQRWSSAFKRQPPGRTNDRRAGRPPFILSISVSSRETSAAVIRAWRGCTSSGRVARIEPRLKSSCCTRLRMSASSSMAG